MSNGKDKKVVEERLYIVRDKAGKERLISATSNTAAQNFIFAPDCKLAKPKDILRLAEAGVKVEHAK